MSIRIGIARRVAFALAVGMGLISCTPAAKPQAGEAQAPAAPEARPVVETPPPAVEESGPPPQSAPGSDFSLTIYSTADPALFSPKDWLVFQGSSNAASPSPDATAPGYAVVRDVRRLKLDAGLNHVEFTGVPRGIDPTTVSFQSLTAPKTTTLVEQNLTPAKSGSAKPTLNWNVSTDKAGDHQILVTYQTDGLSWRADYAVVMSADERSADISAWITALNISGLTYSDAKLKLVAGDVDRLAGNNHGILNEGLIGGGSMALNAAGRESVILERGFSNYHVYTLARPTSLPDNSVKQIELFPPQIGVPLSRNYVFHAIPHEERKAVIGEPIMDQSFGVQDKPAVDIYAEFHNGEAEHIGMPLPAGRVRIYKIDPADGRREFIGEDVVSHSAKDDDVLLRLAAASDIISERRQIEFKEGDKSLLETFEITLRSHRAAPVHILVRETLYRWSNWDIAQSSDKWDRKDRRTIQIPVDVPANGEKAVTYSVKYSW